MHREAAAPSVSERRKCEIKSRFCWQRYPGPARRDRMKHLSADNPLQKKLGLSRMSTQRSPRRLRHSMLNLTHACDSFSALAAQPSAPQPIEPRETRTSNPSQSASGLKGVRPQREHVDTTERPWRDHGQIIERRKRDLSHSNWGEQEDHGETTERPNGCKSHI